MGERKIHYTTCIGCHGGCGVKVTTEDGVIVHIEGNPRFINKGGPCVQRDCPVFSTLIIPTV